MTETEARTGNRCRILIVDDNQTNVEILEEMLSSQYDLKTACSGQEALCIACEFKPDIVLLDIMMPDLNGYEVCGRIRQIEPLRYTKIIMVSAKALVQERMEGYRAGADDYIVKPFEQDELLAKISVYSRLKSAEEVNTALEQALRKSQEAERIKKEFLANMSHEIRTPMNSIIGFSEILNEEPGLTPEHRKYVGMILSNSKILLQLINDILDYSNIEANGVALDPEWMDLETLLSNLDTRGRSLAEEKRIEFKVIREPSLPPSLYTHEVRLRQVILNLIQNAVKFTEKGHVYLRVSAAVRDGKEMILFVVEDTGIGISPEKKEVILNPFVQADGGASRKFGGLGLGLAIAQRLICLMGGHLLLESRPNEGSVFTVELPVKQEQPADVPDYEGVFHKISSDSSPRNPDVPSPKTQTP